MEKPSQQDLDYYYKKKAQSEKERLATLKRKDPKAYREMEDKKMINVIKDTFIPGHKEAKIADRKRRDRNASIGKVAIIGIGVLASVLLSNDSNK